MSVNLTNDSRMVALARHDDTIDVEQSPAGDRSMTLRRRWGLDGSGHLIAMWSQEGPQGQGDIRD